MTVRQSAICATLVLCTLSGVAGWLVGVPVAVTATVSLVASAALIRNILRRSPLVVERALDRNSSHPSPPPSAPERGGG